MGQGTLARQCRETRDPFMVGDLGHDQRSLGYGLTLGRRFPVRQRLTVLVRRTLYPVPNRWHVCGLALAGATEIRNRAAYAHGANTAWQYAVFTTDGNGYTSAASEPTRVDFDGAGAVITPRLPNPPVEVRAEAIAGGLFRISWSYDPYGQGDWPAEFELGESIAPGWSIAWRAAWTAVPFVAGQREYTFVTPFPLPEGTPREFGVRARSSGGVSEQNTYRTEVVLAKANAPDAASVQLVQAQMRPPVNRRG